MSASEATLLELSSIGVAIAKLARKKAMIDVRRILKEY